MKLLGLFPQVLSMSLTAGVVILFVLAARLPLKRAPKLFSYLLWAVVLFRLLCPVSFSSALSLFRAVEMPEVSGAAYGQFQQTADTTAQVLPTSPLPGTPAAAVPETATDPLAVLWLAGAAALLVYGAVSLLRLRRRLAEAVPLEGRVYLVDHIPSPFVLGVFRPRIYLPSSLPEAERGYILLHERTHIRRGDHLFRLLAFAALAVHWFNPLVWLAFFLSERDMEMACDEAVMRRSGQDIRAEYAASLLRLSTGRRFAAGIPLAFGEGDPRGRIRNVMRYKRPLLGAAAVSLAAVAALAVILAADPPEEPAGLDSLSGKVYQVDEILYHAPVYSFTFTPETAPQYLVSGENVLSEGPSALSFSPWAEIGALSPVTYSREELHSLFMSLYNYSSAREALDSVKAVWRAETQGEDDGRFYLLMQTRSNGLLLAYGYQGEEGSHVRWLFRLGDSGQSYEDADKVRQAMETLEAQLPQEEVWGAQVAGDTVVLLSSTRIFGMPRYSNGFLTATILDPSDAGYAVMATYCHETVKSVGFSAAAVRGSGLTVVFGLTRDRLWNFRTDEVTEPRYTRARVLYGGGEVSIGVSNNSRYFTVIDRLVDITDIEYYEDNTLLARYSEFIGEMENQKA